MTSKVTGIPELRASLAKLSREVRREVVQEATKTGAESLRSKIIRHLHQDTATGRQRSSTPGDIASAQGQYPKTDNGILANSISVQERNGGADVIANAEHAAHLELKDESAGGRPFMSRALNENRQMITRRVVRSLVAILQRPKV